MILEKTTNPAIMDFLAKKDAMLSAHVSTDGVIYCEEPQDEISEMALGALLRVVRQHDGAGEILKMDPVAFGELGRNKDAAVSTAESQKNKPVDPSSKAARIADHIVNRGIELSASDFFIDIRDNTGFISYKVHGLFLPEKMDIDKETAQRVIRSMWNKGNRDWDPSGPCDVTFTAGSADNPTRVRGNSLVERTRGHAVACRLRNPKEIIPLHKAGYLKSQLKAFERMASAPGGLLVVAGPTDSGKSTTLTSIVDSMPRSLRKIEIADPPELFLDHCVHISIERRVDGSYADLDKVLGAIVRQNPDVLILGEIRDKLSAATAMGMCQQGKRVYTSLHANGCAGVPPRLADLGIDLNLLGFREFFIGCASQNLVALLCDHCKREANKENANETEYLDMFGDGVRFCGEGCHHCSNGTAGQTVVAEVYCLIDDPGPAYELIRLGEFGKLSQYMVKEHGAKPKHAAATLLATRGRVDPIDVARRIGRFPGRTAKTAEADA